LGSNNYEMIYHNDEIKRVLVTGVSATITSTNSRLPDIYLTIDNKGSTITIKNLERITSDTIRIPSWTIYQNQLDDSVFQTLSYYNHIGNRMIRKPYKQRKSYNQPKRAGSGDTLHAISYLVNSVSYTTVLEAYLQEQQSWACGYVSEEDERVAANWRNDRKRKYKRLACQTISFRKLYRGAQEIRSK
jgi:hypothetical protein